MNLDLKAAYDYGRIWIKQHEDITIESLVTLASKVMARTGSEYNSLGGSFDASKVELRKLNVTAGAGGRSYMNWMKVPMKLKDFCEELNKRRKAIDTTDELSIAEDTDIFINCMAKLHCEHLQQDIDHFLISASDKMVDKTEILQEMVDKWSIKPTLAGKLADIIVFMADKEEIRTEQLVTQLGLAETTAKRYLRQLTEFGYLEAHGGNRNKSYTKKV